MLNAGKPIPGSGHLLLRSGVLKLHSGADVRNLTPGTLLDPEAVIESGTRLEVFRSGIGLRICREALSGCHLLGADSILPAPGSPQEMRFPFRSEPPFVFSPEGVFKGGAGQGVITGAFRLPEGPLTGFFSRYAYWGVSVLKKHAAYIGILVFLSLLGTALLSVSARINQLAFFTARESSTPAPLLSLALSMGIAFLALALLHIRQRRVENSITASFDLLIKSQYLHSALGAGSTVGIERSAGDWMNRFGEFMTLGGTFRRIFESSLIELSSLAILILALSHRSTPLVGVLLGGLVGFALVEWATVGVNARHYPRVAESGAQYEEETLDQIQGILQIRAMDLQHWMGLRYKQKLTAMLDSRLRLDSILQGLGFLRGTISTACQMISIWIVAGWVSRGEAPISTGIGTILLLQPILNHLESLANTISVTGRAKFSMQRAPEVIRLAETPGLEGPSPEEFSRIEFRNLHYHYPHGTEAALTRFQASLLPGKVTALLGRSGSGKSTLAGLIGGVRMPSSGGILVDGIPLDAIPKKLRTERIEQFTRLFKGSVLENVTVGHLTIDTAWALRCLEAAELTHDLLKKSGGIQQEISEDGAGVSEGQRQRLAIARALYRKPSVLILDESTSALDNPTEVAIYRNLQKILPGMTLVIITHRISNVQFADRILLLEKGRLLAEGRHEELLKTCPAYRELCSHA